MWSTIARRRAALLQMTRDRRRSRRNQGYSDRDPPPATEADVAAVERHHGIALPTDYRRFLIEVANGGVGPLGYPLLPIAEAAADSRGRFDRPFPFHRTWIAHDPEEAPLDDEALARARYSLSLAGVIGEDASFEPCLYPVDLETVDDGALCLGTAGCDLDYHLVLVGPHRGEVWHSRTAGVGRVAGSFFEWYVAWLDDAEERVPLPERVIWLIEQGRAADALDRIAAHLEPPERSLDARLVLPAAAARRAHAGDAEAARALIALDRAEPDWLDRLCALAAHVAEQYARALDRPLVEYTLTEAQRARADLMASGRLDWHFRRWRSARDAALVLLGDDEAVLRIAVWFELQIGEPRAALTLLDRAPRRCAYMRNLEGCAWLDLGEAARAEAALSQVVTAQPTWNAGRSNLALAWGLAGRIDEARAAYRDILSGDGVDEWDLMGLAQTEVFAGQLDRAAAIVRSAVFDKDLDLWRVAIDPCFAPLHATDAYRALVRDYST